MVFKEPIIFPADGNLATLPDGPAVYLIRTREGQAYLGRTNILRRRLARLFAKWKLAELASHVECWLREFALTFPGPMSKGTSLYFGAVARSTRPTNGFP